LTPHQKRSNRKNYEKETRLLRTTEREQRELTSRLLRLKRRTSRKVHVHLQIKRGKNETKDPCSSCRGRSGKGRALPAGKKALKDEGGYSGRKDRDPLLHEASRREVRSGTGRSIASEARKKQFRTHSKYTENTSGSLISANGYKGGKRKPRA